RHASGSGRRLCNNAGSWHQENRHNYAAHRECDGANNEIVRPREPVLPFWMVFLYPQLPLDAEHEHRHSKTDDERSYRDEITARHFHRAISTMAILFHAFYGF